MEPGNINPKGATMVAPGDGLLSSQPPRKPRSVPSAELLSVGDHVGRFELLRPLGEGGMGVVFVALDPELQREVAVKVLRSEGAGTTATQAQQRMLREAQAMAMVSHPNLVTIFEVGTYQKEVFIAMEYVPGISLEDWMLETHPLEDILDVFTKAGRGLQAAHIAGLVHRDFKPANVMVSPGGQVKVLDLGIARKLTEEQTEELRREPAHKIEAPAEPVTAAAPTGSTPPSSGSAFDSQLTQDGAIVGTLAYMAPEQLLAQEVSPKADQFSFGVALYEALTGKMPFPGSNAMELMANIMGGSPRPWPESSEVPVALQDVINRTLASDPGDRFENMKQLLEECQKGLGVRGQIRFLTKRWESYSESHEYLLSDGELLTEGQRLLSENPQTFTEKQARLLTKSWNFRRQRKLQRRAMIGGLGVLTVGFLPTTWLLDRRNTQLEASLQSEVLAHIEAVRQSVTPLFTEAAKQVSLMFAQRAIWMPFATDLFKQNKSAGEDALRDKVVKLNQYFRPVIESAPQISSLMVARDDGVEYLAFDDADAENLDPPYRFYNRFLHQQHFRGEALQLFWPEATDPIPRVSWLAEKGKDSRGQVWKGYDPTRRPWFIQAAQQTVPVTTWTNPYLFFVTKDAGITASIGWKEGEHQYVLGVDFMLTDLSRVTTELATPDFIAVVLTMNAEIIGLPRDERFATQAQVRAFFKEFDAKKRLERSARPEADAEADLPRPPDVSNSLLAAAVNRRNKSSLFQFEYEGETLWGGQGKVGPVSLGLTILVVQKASAG